MICERVHGYVPLQEAANFRSDRCLAIFARNAKTSIEPLSLDVVRHALRLCVKSWCNCSDQKIDDESKENQETKKKKRVKYVVGEAFQEDKTRQVLFPSNLTDQSTLSFENNEIVVVRRSRKPYFRYGRIVSIGDFEMKVLVEPDKMKRLRVGSQQVGKLLEEEEEEDDDEVMCTHSVHLSHDGYLDSSECILRASEQLDTKRHVLENGNDDEADDTTDERLSDHSTCPGNTSRCVAILLELIGLMSPDSSSSTSTKKKKKKNIRTLRRSKVIV